MSAARIPVLSLFVRIEELGVRTGVIGNVPKRRWLAEEAQELDDALFDGMKHDSQLRIVPVPILSGYGVFPHSLSIRVRGEFNRKRSTTSCTSATLS